MAAVSIGGLAAVDERKMISERLYRRYPCNTVSIAGIVIIGGVPPTAHAPIHQNS